MANIKLKRIGAASILVALGLGVTACSAGGSADAGDTVRVALANHPWSDLVETYIPEFEEETGITVQVSKLGETQLSDQYNVKLNTGSSDLDVMMFRPSQETKLFVSNGWVSDLGEYVESSGEWDWADYPTTVQLAAEHDDVLAGIPVLSEHHIMYYRTDLLAEAGLEIPATFEELEDAARIVQERNPGVSGFVSAGQRAAAVTRFSSFLFGFGGDFVNDKGEATLDTAEAIEAYEYYSRLLREYGPEGVSNMEWKDAMAVFAQGKAAFYTEADVVYKNAIDPASSSVVDSVGFAPFPAGPAGRHAFNIASWSLGINEFSKNKDTAWAFIEWVTNKTNSLRVQQEGLTGFRTSIWETADSMGDAPQDFQDAILASVEGSVGYDRPSVVKIGEARDIVGGPIVAGLNGEDVKAAAKEAQKAFATLLTSER